jgi:hypothetical protein
MARILTAVFAVVLFLHPALGAAGGNEADTQLVLTLMRKSGLDKQLEQIPAAVQAGIDQAQQQQKGLSPDDMAALKRLSAVAFDVKALNDAVRTHVQANMNGKDLEAALAWLGSPLGERITGLEEAASTPQAVAEMQSTAGRLAGDKARVEKMKKLDVAVQATESNVRMVLNMQVVIAVAMTASMEPDQQPSADAILHEVNKNSAQLRSMIEQQILLSFLYAYRSLTDAELDRYIAFAESAAGKKYQTVTSEAVSGAMVDAGRKLGSLLGEDMKNRKKNSKEA